MHSTKIKLVCDFFALFETTDNYFQSFRRYQPGVSQLNYTSEKKLNFFPDNKMDCSNRHHLTPGRCNSSLRRDSVWNVRQTHRLMYMWSQLVVILGASLVNSATISGSITCY